MPVATIGLVGDDADGHALMTQAAQEGLDVSGLLMLDGQGTTFTMPSPPAKQAGAPISIPHQQPSDA